MCQWVKTVEEIVKRYRQLFRREFGTLPGAVHLEVDKGTTLVVAPPRRIPTSLKGPLKQWLDRLQKLEVIAPIDEFTPWVGNLAVAVKRLGALRICTAPRLLNTALKREQYQLAVL